MLLQLKKSVDFNGVGFVLIESIIFEIHTHPRFLHSIDAKYYIVYITHFEYD